MNLQLILGAMAADLAAQLTEKEAADAAELGARGDCQTLLITEGEKLLGYAVLGVDLGDMVTIYMARAVGGGIMAKALMMGLIGAAQVAGKPLRVHADTIGRAKAMARAAGVSLDGFGEDGDGVPMGFYNVKQK